jgi:hypothetical protein
MGEHTTRESRLRALRRLLEYASVEAEQLALTPIERLLKNASVAVGSALDARRNVQPTSPPIPQKGGQIKLVINKAACYKKGNETGL